MWKIAMADETAVDFKLKLRVKNVIAKALTE